MIDRTKRFALSVIQLYSGLPSTTVAQVLGKQLLRAATSVGAQYREAQRAKSVPDFVSKVEGALQELEEAGYWLELLIESKTLDDARHTETCNEVEELTAIFAAIAKSAKVKIREKREKR